MCTVHLVDAATSDGTIGERPIQNLS